MANINEARRRHYDLEAPMEGIEYPMEETEYTDMEGVEYPVHQTILQVLGLDGIYHEIRYVLTTILIHL
jgi:hypothetical protein